MKPIDVDELFNRKASNNELDLTLNVNDPTEEPVVANNITQEYYVNTDRLDEESIGNLGYVRKNR